MRQGQFFVLFLLFLFFHRCVIPTTIGHGKLLERITHTHVCVSWRFVIIQSEFNSSHPQKTHLIWWNTEKTFDPSVIARSSWPHHLRYANGTIVNASSIWHEYKRAGKKQNKKETSNIDKVVHSAKKKRNFRHFSFSFFPEQVLRITNSFWGRSTNFWTHEPKPKKTKTKANEILILSDFNDRRYAVDNGQYTT